MEVQACHPSYVESVNRSIHTPISGCLGINVRSYLKKYLRNERGRGLAQVVEDLPSKHKTLSPTPQYCQKTKTNQPNKQKTLTRGNRFFFL
jgi:hypothetical protein